MGNKKYCGKAFAKSANRRVIMIDGKKLNQSTLADVIERKIHFTNTNTIYDKTEFKDINEGELLAYYGKC